MRSRAELWLTKAFKLVGGCTGAKTHKRLEMGRVQFNP